MRVVTPLAVAGTVMLALGPASAEERPFFLRLGGAHVGFDERASVSVGGATVPGGNARLEDNWGIAIEGGYFFTPDISVSLALGVPPTTTVRGAGSLAPAGALGDVTYGPSVLSVRYHFLEPGGIRPYIGAGVSYTVVFDTKDKALRNLDVDNALGAALVAGVDVPITERWGGLSRREEDLGEDGCALRPADLGHHDRSRNGTADARSARGQRRHLLPLLSSSEDPR